MPYMSVPYMGRQSMDVELGTIVPLIRRAVDQWSV
jgi:hypothetical protein